MVGQFLQFMAIQKKQVLIIFYSNSTFDTLEIYTGSEIVDQQLYVEFDNKFIRE
jgi:hypothetical protein